MVDEIQLDKRRRQNRDSQRRFRERNKRRRSWTTSNASYAQHHHAALNESSGPLCTNTGNPSPERPNTGIPNDYQSLLTLANCSEAYNDWSNDGSQSIHSEALLYRHGGQSNGLEPLPSGQMSLAPLSEQFPLQRTSMSGANPNSNRHQQQQQNTSRHTSGTRGDGMLSPVSLLGSDIGLPSTAPASASTSSKPSRPHETPFLPQRPKRRRRSGSKAEQMISDVERLHEFGISLSLFPDDPLLRRSLKRMKERFQNLIVLGVACSERDFSDGDYSDSESYYDDQGDDE